MGERNADSSRSLKYGVPLYEVSGVPLKNILNQNKPKEEEEEEQDDKKQEEQDESTTPTTTTTTKTDQRKSWLVLAGGGGEGSSGVPNSLLLTQFDYSSNSLSETPVRHECGTDLPYRMAVHPGGEGIIVSFPQSCRWFEWNAPTGMESNDLSLRSSEKVLTPLQDVGQQLALTFDREGSVLAAGSENGHLRVFKWPSMEVILDEADAHPTVKDLDFSPDGKFLVSLGGGPCRIWDVTKSMVIASLAKENGENFCFCRFSQSSDGTQILYIAAMQGKRGGVVSWNTTSWERLASKQIVNESMSAFDVSADGKILAIGTIDGDIVIVASTNMRVMSRIKKAHMGIITTIKFLEDSRSLISASFDASVRVAVIEDKKQNGGLNILLVIFIVMLAMLAYYMSNKEALPL